MKQSRVLLANMPPILGRILTDLVNGQPDMAVVGEVRSLAELPPAIASLRAEAVILTFPRPAIGRAIYRAIRRRHPSLTILGHLQGVDRIVVWPASAAARCIDMTASGVIRALREHRTGRGIPRAREIH